MTPETTTAAVEETAAVPTAPASATPPKQAEALIVTSSKTVDFPSLNWGIHAGEERDLPADKAAQEAILACSFISTVN